MNTDLGLYAYALDPQKNRLYVAYIHALDVMQRRLMASTFCLCVARLTHAFHGDRPFSKYIHKNMHIHEP